MKYEPIPNSEMFHVKGDDGAVLATVADKPEARLFAASEDLNASLAEIYRDDVLFAWCNEKNIGKKEWDRRRMVVERARLALVRASGKEA